MRRAMQLVEQFQTEEKVIIFSHFLVVLDCLGFELQTRNINFGVDSIGTQGVADGRSAAGNSQAVRRG